MRSIYSCIHELYLVRLSFLVPGQIRSAWKWYHWIGPGQDINPPYIFDFLNLTWILIGVQSADPLITKIPAILLLFRQTGCVRANRPLFQRTGLQKMPIHLCFEGGLVFPKQVRNTDDEFKSVPAIRKKGFYTNHLPKDEVYLCLAALDFKLFSKTFKI